MTENSAAFPSSGEQRAAGADARTRVPASDHAGWLPATDRPDPVAVLAEQNLTREQDLVPVRHGRMMASPFTFYRGAAAIMAADLAPTATAGLQVQLCGDAHLSNFGMFGSPERRLVFDLNDFDETLPGPFEYDVKRMAASFTIAGQNNGFTKKQARDITAASVRAYREAMNSFARMSTMELWYAHLAETDIRTQLEATRAAAGDKHTKKDKKGKPSRKPTAGEKVMTKAHTRDSLQALSKLGERVDGRYRIVSQPPVIIPARDLAAHSGVTQTDVENVVREQFQQYRDTLQDDRRRLLERFQVVDAARKVVGVGSVGTRAYIALLQGPGEDDVLFLQVKEAGRSVLENHLPTSAYRTAGERVVQGQRMMQAVSDIYLGWTIGAQTDRHFYWRQLRDMKASVEIEVMAPDGLTFYAGLCGWTLARAHARSGHPAAIAEYLGQDNGFDDAITDFSQRYADQNNEDYQSFTKAISTGRLSAVEGV